MKRPVYLSLGLLFLGLGIAGVILPVVPGTVFLIIAAGFFSKSSEKLHGWLLNHKYLGPPVRRWENEGVIPLRAKVLATVMILAGSAYPVVLSDYRHYVRIGVGAFIAIGLIYIWTRPSGVRAGDSVDPRRP